MAWRRAESRALTGPFPSAVATTRASSTRTFTVASVRCRPLWAELCVWSAMTRNDSTVEEVRLPSRGPAKQELEGSVGHLEVVAAVLERLQGVEHPESASESSSSPSSWALSARVDRPAISDTTKRVPLPTESGWTCS